MRAEIIVFALIALFLLAGSLLAITMPASNSSLSNLGKAPEFSAGNWINSQPLKISDLKGKVILVDFWTYSCINCIRTLPFLESWNEKYSGKGLVIIGVHTPEFEFEKIPQNVKDAVTRFGIKYPVVQDNDRNTWNAYKNNFWPRHYLIDKEGDIRYDHIGEGGYAETEAAIQQLLGVKMSMTNMSSDIDLSQLGSPELYLGYQFARAPLGNEEGFQPGIIVDYITPNITSGNVAYLSGKWMNSPESLISINNSKMFLIYRAKKVNIVAGGNATARILIEGFPASGDDVVNGSVQINSQRLYNIISMPDYGTHLLEIDAQPGLHLYTFTFG